MRKFFWLLLLPLALWAQDEAIPDKTPEQIEVELKQAEDEYNRALKMFNPWYTGPLITPSATMMPPGHANTQPYLFIIDNYASFNSHRKSVNLPSHLVQLKGTANVLTGVTNNFDINIQFAAQGNWQHHHSGGGFGDTSITGGFLIYRQTPYVPAFKLTIAETLPTGRYKKLDRFGLKGTGGGTYATQFGLAIAKLIRWTTPHPMNLRWFFGYTLSTVVNVKGFNTYGGGHGCNGRVRPGNSFSFDFGYEVSFTQKWVGALDFVYTYTESTKFHGNPGVLDNGTPATVGSGYSDQMSLAPAIEYNFNENVGLIAGAWFTVYGRNSLNFGAAVISVSVSYP